MNTCENCSKSFRTKIGLKQHINVCIDMIERKFVCEFCHKELLSKQNLSYHLKVCKIKKENDKQNLDKLRHDIEQLSKETEELKLLLSQKNEQIESQNYQLREKDSLIKSLTQNVTSLIDTSYKTISTVAT